MEDVGAGTVGAPMDRVDGRLKVTGGARYAAEFPAKGVRHAVLAQSTVAKGTVTRIDVAACRALPGVVEVVTTDTPGVGTLLTKDVTHSGQTVAVVVAETFEAAQHAAERLKVTYDAQPPKADFRAAAGSASPGRPRTRGDVAAGLAAGAKRVEQTYATPHEHHNPLEPHGTVAVWEGESLTVYDATQGVISTAQTVAKAMGVPLENVHVMDPFVGGGFGCKGNSWPHTSLCALAARVVGSPVRLSLTRKQMFTSNGHRPATRQGETFAASEDGRLTAIVHDGVCSQGIKDGFVESAGVAHPILYACANASVNDRGVKLDIPAGTYMRAPGEASGTFGLETAMDELAYELGIDPLELRLRNHADVDPSNGKAWSSKSLKACYMQASERFGWSARSPKPGSMRKGNLRVGMGMATATYPSNFIPATARVSMDARGKARVQIATQDLGTGTYTILTQIAAEALGIDPRDVRVEIADSHLPNAPLSGGSWSATSAGSAVKLAGAALRARLGGDPKGYRDAVGRARAAPVSAEATAQREPGARDYSFHGFGAQFCEVHVDPELRTIRVARWVGAFGLGKVLNEKTLRSQLQGGVVWGIGMGLLEESVMDPRFGRFVNSNLAEYHVPVNRDVPDVEIIMVPEEDRWISPLGAKGAGEIGITGACAALGNAIYHATGKRVRDLPITLDKIM